ncbi:sensor histidine kinase [Shimazuella kribbensis]|uniref:sensor histidine kinase n=1 Tax=Shimazuella kribbensis TaxID=139808 RepID=UPI00048E2382|nr:HAMP domain-containing sensor histidine kinase [Shimazuella kribbensis]
MMERLKSFFSHRSLQIQLLSRTLLILAFLLVLIGFFQYVFMKDVVYKNKATSLQSQIMSIPPFVWDDITNSPEQRSSLIIPETSLAFIDIHGNYSVVSTEKKGKTPPKLANQVYRDVLKGTGSIKERVAVASSGEEELVVLQLITSKHGEIMGLIQISTPTGPLKELLIRQLFTFLGLSFIAMLIGVMVFLPLLRKTLVPLFNMVDIAEQIDAGNLARRFETKQGQIEIDRLAQSCNGMLERLEASFEAERKTKEKMRQFVADASHELRTPLTSIHGFLEILLRGASKHPEQLDKALHSMYSESNRLNKLVKDLLLLTKLDQSPPIILSEGYLDAVVHEMEPHIRILVGDRKLSLEIEPDLKCDFDADKMKQVILNLIHNAIQHTDPQKGHIQIKLKSHYKGIQLSIHDNGIGISKTHLPRVFDRFYRSDSSRTRKYGGAGLGLSITKSIIDTHNGTIRITSTEGKGSTFYVWIPC